MTGASHRLLADLRAMARTGRHSDERPVGAALASRLPRLIAGVAELLNARGQAGGHVHG